MDESGATAIISLQSDACLEALQIDYGAIYERACKRGLVAARVAVRDFDHNDQAAMLPEAVRMLHTLTALGHRVYLHCTAGINRATLTAVGYLTFVLGWGLDDALSTVKKARPQAHPYVDCWRTVRRRLVEGRGDEVTLLAREVFQERRNRGDQGSSNADWEAAEVALIKRTFKRQTEATLSVLRSLKIIADAKQESAVDEAVRKTIAEGEELAKKTSRKLARENKSPYPREDLLKAVHQAEQELVALGAVLTRLTNSSRANSKANV